jgi:hypothetical protein
MKIFKDINVIISYKVCNTIKIKMTAHKQYKDMYNNSGKCRLKFLGFSQIYISPIIISYN